MSRCRHLRQLFRLRGEALLDVFAAADDGGGGLPERAVLLDHRVDGVLVGDLGVVLLDVRDPEADEAAPEVAEAAEEVRRGHGVSP
jgi:hypothetical protein